MKKRDLEKFLEQNGWFKKREGSNHEWWTDGKGNFEALPRHREIKEVLANKIMRTISRLKNLEKNDKGI